jgi:hypothetical protein
MKKMLKTIRVAISLFFLVLMTFTQTVYSQTPNTSLVAYYSNFLKTATSSEAAAHLLINSGSKTLVFDGLVGTQIKVSNLKVKSNSTILIKKGITLIVPATSNKYDNVFILDKVNNVKILGESGAKITAQKALYKDGEWRHHIYILSSKNIEVSGLTIENSGGDGVYLGSAYATAASSSSLFINDQIYIKNNIIDNNSRNGVSIIQGRNIYVENNVISNTKSYPGSGVATHGPGAGIDIEPNIPAEQLYNVRIINNQLTGNNTAGIILSLATLKNSTKPVLVAIEKNNISRSNTGFMFGVGISSPGNIILRNNNISEYKRHAIWILGKSINGPKLDISSTSVNDSLAAASHDAGLHTVVSVGNSGYGTGDGNVSIVGTKVLKNAGKYLVAVDSGAKTPLSKYTMDFTMSNKIDSVAVYKGRGYSTTGFNIKVSTSTAK